MAYEAYNKELWHGTIHVPIAARKNSQYVMMHQKRSDFES